MDEYTYIVITTTFDGGLIDSYTVQSTESRKTLVRDISLVANGLFYCRESLNQIVISQMDAKTEVPTDLNFKFMLKCAQNLGLKMELVENDNHLAREGRLAPRIKITGEIITPYSEGTDTMLCRVVLNADDENGPVVTNYNESIEVKVGNKELCDLTKFVHQTFSSISTKFIRDLTNAMMEPNREWAMGQSDASPEQVPELTLEEQQGIRPFTEMMNSQIAPCCGHHEMRNTVEPQQYRSLSEVKTMVEQSIAPELHESEVLTTVKETPAKVDLSGYTRVSPVAPITKVRENPDFLMSVVIVDNVNEPRVRYVKFSGATSELGNNGFIAAMDREITLINGAGGYGKYGLSLSGDENGLMQLQQSGPGTNYANIVHRSIDAIGLSSKVDVDFLDMLPEQGSYVSRIQDVF